MSAYVNRLLHRFSPSHANMAAAAEPFVRSHSPIAEFDQRPGSEDSFEPEPGIPNVSPNLEAPPEVAPAPRIHRKAMAQPIAPSPSAVSSPAIAPTPTSLTPSIAVPPISPPTSTAVPSREPLDPGPLFDIFPRYFDTSEPPHPPSNQPRIFEGRSEPISTLAKPKPAAFEVEATPRRLSPAPRRELELRSPTIEAPPRPAPWAPIEHDIPESRTITTPLVNPTNRRRSALLSSTLAPAPTPAPSPAPLHYATPRAAAPAPYIPDPSPHPSGESSANARPRVHIGRVEIEVVPSNSPSPAQSGAAPKQKLSIDSISQIGPLGQYFPSRRLLRLRYR